MFLALVKTPIPRTSGSSQVVFQAFIRQDELLFNGNLLANGPRDGSGYDSVLADLGFDDLTIESISVLVSQLPVGGPLRIGRLTVV